MWPCVNQAYKYRIQNNRKTEQPAVSVRTPVPIRAPALQCAINMAPLPVTLTSRFNNILSEFRPKLLHAEQIRRTVRREILINHSEIANLSTRSLLLRRGLSVDSTQKVTLGVIAAYAIVIAILWNLPYVRWSLWPFKVSDKQQHKALFVDTVTKSLR